MSKDRAVHGLPHQDNTNSTSGKNYLFAIGISVYQKFDSLPNAVKDIIDLSQLLQEEYSFEQVQVLLDQEATKDNIVDKLNDLRRVVTKNDRLLIYYSGHGYMDGERGFWIPTDAEPDKVSSYVSNADVHDTIKVIKAKHLLLISDSCFSGSLLTRDVSTKMEGAFDEWDKKSSRFVFISGGGPVSDGKPGENSPFANSIINQLKESNEDHINICKLADQVTQEVRYNYKQQAEVSPLFDAGHMGGQFVFVKKRTENELWALANTNNDEGSFLDYLNKYPNGLFKLEAEKKLKDIGDENEWYATKEKNAAFAYRHYLRIYPDGLHVQEAKDRLEQIRLEDIQEKEKTREEAQRKSFEAQKEKKEKENIIDVPQPAPQPISRPNTQPIIQPKPQSRSQSQPDKLNNNNQGFFKKNIFIIAFLGLIVLPGSIIWYLKTTKSNTDNDSSMASDQFTDTTISTVNTLHESNFVISGNIIDGVNQNKLSGITVTNKRSKNSTSTDTAGLFVIENTVVGDTLFINENENYFSKLLVVGNVADLTYIGLEKKQRITENKIISGTVSGSIIEGVWVYVKRNGKIIKPYDHADKKGIYELKGVNEGDILWFDTGRGKFSKKITQENIYDFNGSSIAARLK